MLHNLCDTHVHTIFSRHAYSTIEEDVRAAAREGLELVGIADHYSPMVATELRPLEYQHFFNMGVVPRRWMGVYVLRGAETDIVDLDGHLFGHGMTFEPQSGTDVWRSPAPLEDQALRLSDYAIASIHGREFTRDATPAQITGMYVKALGHEKVLMLGHIGRTGLPYELGPIIRACAETGKLLEINEHSFHFGQPGDDRNRATTSRCRELALACAEAGVSIALNTDAHISCQVGHYETALTMLEEIDFPQELIATTDAHSFITAVERAIGPISGL